MYSFCGLFLYTQHNRQKRSVDSVIIKSSQSDASDYHVWEIWKAQNKYNQDVF